ncbi:MAG: glycogen debranching enzyme, partial [Planctomycetota bacterium]
WFDWDLVKEHRNVFHFVKELIRFRRETPGLRRTRFLSGEFTGSGWCPDISWFNFDGSNVFDWHGPELPLAVLLSAQVDGQKGNDMFLLFNPTGHPRVCKLPEDVTERKWRVFVDTACESPNDIFPDYDGPLLPKSGEVELPHYSLRCYVTNASIGNAQETGKY